MKICQHCGFENPERNIYCEKCGQKFTDSVRTERINQDPQAPRFPTDPAKVLDEVILTYIKTGYQLIAKTDTTAQLIRSKDFSFGKAFAFGLLYVAHRASKKDPSAFVTVNPDGSYQIIDENGRTQYLDAGQPLTLVE